MLRLCCCCGSQCRITSYNVCYTKLLRSAHGAGQGEALNWAGLLGLVFGVPKALLFIIFAFGFVLFSIFGPFLVLPLIALVLFTGPMRSMLGPDTRRQVNGFVVSRNNFV